MISNKLKGYRSESYRTKVRELMTEHNQDEESILAILALPISDKDKYDIMVEYFQEQIEKLKKEKEQENQPTESMSPPRDLEI